MYVGAKYYNLNGVWDLKPLYLSPWTLGSWALSPKPAASDLGLGFRFWGLGCGSFAESSTFKVWGLGFEV